MVIQYVAASPGGHPWAYTIGRLSRGRPELVVVGLSVESSAAMLNGIDAEWDAISIPEDGMCTIPSTPSHRFGIVPIPDALWESEYLLGALRYAVEQGLADRLSALQVIWCGPDGVFPWDPEIDEELRRSQPILGLRVSEV